jgi:hypothetical protein
MWSVFIFSKRCSKISHKAVIRLQIGALLREMFFTYPIARTRTESAGPVTRVGKFDSPVVTSSRNQCIALAGPETLKLIDPLGPTRGDLGPIRALGDTVFR